MGVSTELDRAYALVTVKSVDDDQRIIEGIATDISPDRMGDVVEPRGASFKLPIPFLWQHNKSSPIGHVISAEVTPKGIKIRAQIAKGVLPYIEEAWALIRAGLVRGLSIGFRPLADGVESIHGSMGVRFKAWEWLELSAVTIPAHADATITAVKSLATSEPAALGLSAPDSSTHAPALRTQPRVVKTTLQKDQAMKKTYAEQVKDLENTIAAKAAEREAIHTKAADEGRAKDDAERETFDTLGKDIQTLTAELADAKELEKQMATKAVAAAGTSTDDASRSRGGDTNIVRFNNETLPKGIGFARAVKVAAVARLDGRNPLDLAKSMYPSDDRLHAHLAFQQNLPNVIAQIKAAVPAATTTNTTWASALVDPTNLPGEFIEYLRPATIIGKMNFRSLPFNVRMIEQTQGGTGYWVGQGAPKPLTAFGFEPVTLSPMKVAAIAVATEEAVRFSSPSLDMLVRDALRDALVERIDRDLLDPAEAGTANVQPASLTNGLTAGTSAGTSADNVRTDIAGLVQNLRSANLRGPIVLVMPDSLATAIAFMATSLGTREFPDATSDGGSINGIRIVTSEYLANASGGGNLVVAIAEREIFLADDGQVTVDASREASLQMLDNPTNNSATAVPTTMVSMWQTNSIAFRAERFINWQKRRDDAVSYLDDVNWGSIGSPA